MPKKKKKQQDDDCLLDRNDIRRRQRKLYSNLLELVEGIVGEALIDNDISASKLQSLLRSLAWLKEEEGKLQPADFKTGTQLTPKEEAEQEALIKGYKKQMEAYESGSYCADNGRAEAEFRKKYGPEGVDEVLRSGKLSDTKLKY